MAGSEFPDHGIVGSDKVCRLRRESTIDQYQRRALFAQEGLLLVEGLAGSDQNSVRTAIEQCANLILLNLRILLGRRRERLTTGEGARQQIEPLVVST
jgi:hypothetical protein